MYSPEAIPRQEMNSSLFSSSMLKHSMDGEFLKSKDVQSSDLFQQQNSGIMRYRSAPSSFFASLFDGNSNNNNSNGDDFLGNHSPSSESETMFSALMNCNSETRDLNEISDHQKRQQIQFSVDAKGESGNGSGFSNGTSRNLIYDIPAGGSSYNLGMENQNQNQMTIMRMSNGNSSNLVRQSSSPAGFFNGFDLMKEVGNFRAGTRANGEASSSTSGLNTHMNFSSAPHSSSSFMPSITENESWNDSSFSSLKRNRDGDLKMFSSYNVLGSQNEESRTCTPTLTHHLSLPKTSAEMAAVEKFLQFQQDSVPCKIRAKRGCATHPRSIAERMRRTRISERMKKLQELFPNMDKQTNTADMLDLAVEYIKDLQNQVQTLTDKRAKCTCSSKAHQYPHPTA